jgi:glycosyltransferase involved in cell wall biosynthesis
MKLSIITINYNNASGLRQTIKSVVSQKCQEFEYVVIDGGSTDGSVEIIKEYARYIDYWVSEPDNGIYHAMNKGTRAAHGDYCQYLNSGDWLFDENVVASIISHLDDSVDILGGFLWPVMPDKTINKRHSALPKYISFQTFVTGIILHPATFIKRTLLLIRPYNENFKIVSDWIFFIESYLYENAIYKQINVDVVYFDMTGISSNPQNSSLLAKERHEYINTIPLEHFMSYIEVIPDEVYNIYKSLRYSPKLKMFLTIVLTTISQVYLFFNNLFNRSNT